MVVLALGSYNSLPALSRGLREQCPNTVVWVNMKRSRIRFYANGGGVTFLVNGAETDCSNFFFFIIHKGMLKRWLGNLTYAAPNANAT